MRETLNSSNCTVQLDGTTLMQGEDPMAEYQTRLRLTNETKDEEDFADVDEEWEDEAAEIEDEEDWDDDFEDGEEEEEDED